MRASPTRRTHRVYGETRLAYRLGAQLAVSARAKAVEAIEAVKAVKARRRETCPNSARAAGCLTMRAPIG
jgi:hypothetical protein